MILTCPSCGTQYVVKDGAIPPGGRQVRCASCKHSWHQNPEETGESDAGGESPPEAHEHEETVSEATLIEPRSGPEAEERAYEEAIVEDGPSEAQAEAPREEERASDMPPPVAADLDAPPQAEPAEDDFSPFAAPDEVVPRRRRPVVTILILVVLIAAVAAAFWFLAPPEWKARVGLGAAGASPLALVTTHMDRQRLESGNELLTVSGRVINPTTREQDVPPLRAQLRTRAGKVVHSWT